MDKNLKTTEKLIQKYGFTLENPNEILDFVEANREVLDVLKDAKSVISQYFKNSKLVLNLYKDIEENYEVLNIFILNNLSPVEALEQEELLFNNWFFKFYKKLKGKVTIREQSIIDGKCMICGDVADTKDGWICSDCRHSELLVIEKDSIK